MLEKNLGSSLDCKEMKPVNLKGNQSWIFTGRTDVKAEAPTFWPPGSKIDSLEKTPMLGRTEGRRGACQRMRWMVGITDSLDMNLSKLWEMVKHREAWYAAVHGVTMSWIRLSNWTTTLKKIPIKQLEKGHMNMANNQWLKFGEPQTSQQSISFKGRK